MTTSVISLHVRDLLILFLAVVAAAAAAAAIHYCYLSLSLTLSLFGDMCAAGADTLVAATDAAAAIGVTDAAAATAAAAAASTCLNVRGRLFWAVEPKTPRGLRLKSLAIG